ncbi:hypothetical protein BH11PSE3_BH11PSE3_41450 [soil metagenome]
MEPQAPLPASPPDVSRGSALLLRRAAVLPLVLLTLPIEAASAWLLASPDRVYSRTMTWDLLFNLDGAWNIYMGHAAHVDFHDPVGILSFLLTCAGFWIGKATVADFIFGNLLALAFVYVTSVVAARRLPLFPAVVFVLFTCQLVLMPTNVGGLIDDYSFAMSYNAYGWSILCVVAVVLFLPSSPGADRGADRGTRVPWPDLALDLGLTLVLCLALYYLKITYFLAALGMLATALVVCPHIRAHRAVWAATAALLICNALAPYNWPYLADIYGAIEGGAIRSSRIEMLLLFSANTPEIALYGTMLLAAAGLWLSGAAPFRLPLLCAAIIVASLAVLSQNAQLRSLPLCILVALLLYDHLARGHQASGPIIRSPRSLPCTLLALMIFPVADVVSSTLGIALYSEQAKSNDGLFVVDRTNLRGLAVPLDSAGASPVPSNRSSDIAWARRMRAIGGNPPLSQYEYIQSILEAAALFEPLPPGGILVLDAVNPLPFALGWAPARGASLWMDTGFFWRPAQAMFADAQYVLIPKFSTYADLTNEAYKRYGDYLARHFPVRSESRSWTLLRRAPKG